MKNFKQFNESLQDDTNIYILWDYEDYEVVLKGTLEYIINILIEDEEGSTEYDQVRDLKSITDIESAHKFFKKWDTGRELK